jgi:hypothetical protein
VQPPVSLLKQLLPPQLADTGRLCCEFASDLCLRKDLDVKFDDGDDDDSSSSSSSSSKADCG